MFRFPAALRTWLAPSQRRRPLRLPVRRPGLELLEDRLPPGDLFGPLLANLGLLTEQPKPPAAPVGLSPPASSTPPPGAPVGSGLPGLGMPYAPPPAGSTTPPVL